MKKRKKDHQKKVTITGHVMATDWDLNDNVSEVSVETNDDEEYVVEDSGLGEKLFGLFGEEIEVTGMVKEDEDGTKRIRITSYEVLESEYVNTDYEDYEDYELEEDDEEEAFKEGWTH